MNEKIISWLAGLVVIVTLSACGSSAGAQAPKSEAEAGPSVLQAGTPEVEVQAIPTELAPPDSHVVTLESSSSMRVLWTVTGYVIGKEAAWGKEEAEALLFKPLDITDTEIIFDGQACQGVNFQRESAAAAAFLSNAWKTSPEELGIEAQEVQVIRTNCSLPGFQEYLRLADRRLIVPMNGVFFFFEPTVSY